MIIRRRRNRHFTIIGNEVFADDRISLEAMGLLAWLRSKPQDWTLDFDHLRNRFKIGRDKAYRLVNELIDAGWIVKEWQRAGGSFEGIEYVVLDEPRAETEPEPPFPEKPETVADKGVEPVNESPTAEVQLPFPEKPYPAEPYPGNQDALLRIEKGLRTDLNKNHPNPSACGRAAHDPLIEKFREGYEGGAFHPAKVAAVWADLSAEDRAAAVAAVPAYLAFCQKQRRSVKDAHRWLKAREWERFPPGPQSAALSPSASAPQPAALVFVVEGSPQWAAWKKDWAAQGKKLSAFEMHKGDSGRWMRSEWPPETDGRAA